jgi:hypothetical protein
MVSLVGQRSSSQVDSEGHHTRDGLKIMIGPKVTNVNRHLLSLHDFAFSYCFIVYLLMATVKVSTLPAKDPLESLRSPTQFVENPRGRESIAESDFNDIALDDDSAFSPVALTNRQSSASGGNDRTVEEIGRPLSASLPATAFNPSKQFSHKKSASTTTIRSPKNLPFLLARLDLQEESSGSSHRGSVDGQQKLQEEFARLHKEKEETKDSLSAGAIDWGASSDYCASSFVRAVFKYRFLGSGDFWYESANVLNFETTQILRKTTRALHPTVLTN